MLNNYNDTWMIMYCTFRCKKLKIPYCIVCVYRFYRLCCANADVHAAKDELNKSLRFLASYDLTDVRVHLESVADFKW